MPRAPPVPERLPEPKYPPYQPPDEKRRDQRVRGAGGGRVSITGVACCRPGDRPHLYYLLRVVRVIKRRLKKIQHRPQLISGCLAATGLKIEPR